MKSYQADRFQVGQRVIIAWPCEPGMKGRHATIVEERRMRGTTLGERFSYLLMVDGDVAPHVAFQEELRAIEESDLAESGVEEMAG